MLTENRGKTWVVIPAYNEDRTVTSLVHHLKHAGYQVALVADGSMDNTAELAAAAGATVLRHPINLGQGAALQTGIEFSLGHGADVVVTFDADGQHRVADVPKLIEALASHQADFALGSRFLGSAPGMPKLRRAILRAATWFTRATTGLRISDAHNGLRAMTRRGATRIKIRQNRMAHASEILHQIANSGFNYVEVPVSVEYTVYSLGKGRKLGEIFAILLDLFLGRLHR